jgi:hypothetical protein
VEVEGWKSLVIACCLFSLMNSVDYGSHYGSPRECLWKQGNGGLSVRSSTSSRG